MKLVKNSFIYLGTQLINKSIPFLLLPIITRYLTPVEYGVYSIYQVILSFIAPFIGASLDIHIIRNYFKISKEELERVLNSVVLLIHIHMLIALIVLFLFSLFFDNFLGVPFNDFYFIPIIVYAQMINLFNLTILRNKERALEYGSLQIIATFFNFGSVVLLLVFFKLGWESLVYGLLIGQFAIFFYSIYHLKSEYHLDFKKFYPFKKIYKISLPLIFHLLGGSIIFLSDRVFIQQMLNLKELGVYSIGNQFGTITMIIINSIILAITPWMYKKLANNIDMKKEIGYFMFGTLLIGLIVDVISRVAFPYIIPSEYLEAIPIIFWISLAFVFRGWYQIYYNILAEKGKTSIFIYITFISAILNLFLNYFLIKTNGIIGASQATVLAFFMMFLIAFYKAKKDIL